MIFQLVFIVSIIISILAIIFFGKQRKIAHLNSKLDKVGVIFNTVLSILYFPLSAFSMLMFMASEATIGATNQLYIMLIRIFCYITITVPLICIISITLSVILRIKGKSIASFCIQFLPIIVFILNLLFLSSIEKWFK